MIPVCLQHNLQISEKSLEQRTRFRGRKSDVVELRLDCPSLPEILYQNATFIYCDGVGNIRALGVQTLQSFVLASDPHPEHHFQSLVVF